MRPPIAIRPPVFSQWWRIRLFHGLRDAWKDGYGRKEFFSDLTAGATVGVIAVPLSMALAVASGVPPQHGLYTAVVAGFFVPLFGGSRVQVTGPTAAFVVILSPVAWKFGLSGLLTAGLMAGCILFVMGWAKLGRVIHFVPVPVTTGFTAGIGVVIATLQLKDFLGLKPSVLPDHYLDRVAVLWAARHSASLVEMGVGVSTLILLVVWPKINRRVPALLAALGIVTGGVILLSHWVPSLQVETIRSRFPSPSGGGIPQGFPPFSWPWSAHLSTPGGLRGMWAFLQQLFPSALAIAMLGAIESLLSAVVADGMTRTRHNPDAELIALGKGNILCSLFGGIAATGAFARTAANIKAGARSPISAMIHALMVLAILVFFGKYISLIPMAAMSALLLVVAFHMVEIPRVSQLVRVAPRSDILVLAVCFLLTVLFDMVVGVSVGVVLASLLFIRRMAAHTQGAVVSDARSWGESVDIPDDVFVYEIAGPLFFGAVENALGALRGSGRDFKSVVLLMEQVPHLDLTALVGLEEALRDLIRSHKNVILVGVGTQPMRLLKRVGLIGDGLPVKVQPSLAEALQSCSRNSGPVR